MRAVRRLVSSPPLPGPPRARAAPRRASPGRRYAARPRAASRPPSVPCGRPRRCAAPGSACERAPSGTAQKGRATRRSGRGRAGSTEAAPRCGMRRGGGVGRREAPTQGGAGPARNGPRPRLQRKPPPRARRAASARGAEKRAPPGKNPRRDREAASPFMAWCRKYRSPCGGDARADGIASGRRCRRPTRRRTDERRETAARAPRPHGPGIFGSASLARRAQIAAVACPPRFLTGYGKARDFRLRRAGVLG